MKQAILTEHPNYPLLRLTDVVSASFFQLPRWLFCDTRYKTLSLEAKVAYGFLLNRFQLSRLNGWINQREEVYVIFPRERLANEMQISYRKAIEVFQELSAAQLIWEKRLGRGHPNQIYLAVVKLSDEDARRHQSSPYAEEERPAGTAGLEFDTLSGGALDEPGTDLQNCESCSFEDAQSAGSDLQIPQANENEYEKSKRLFLSGWNDLCADFTLKKILRQCQLDQFDPELSKLFRALIERMFYSKSCWVKGAELPQDIVRKNLELVDYFVLSEVAEKMKANVSTKITNPTGYVQSMILDAVCSFEAAVRLDPESNKISALATENHTIPKKKEAEGG